MSDENKTLVDSYAKQISKRLFGKQSPYVLQRDPVEIRSIGFIMENLCKLSDMEWAKYAFSRDPLNGKFDDDTRLALAQKAHICGVSSADECIKKHGTNAPVIIAENIGLVLSYPERPQDGGSVRFAEFRPPTQVNIFMDAVRKARELLEEPGVQEAVGAINIPDILLAHELFHYIEDRQADEIWTKTYKIELWGIGPFRNHSRIVALSEIAAMGFCKRLNGLAFSPYVMDAFLVYGYSAENATRLFKEMMTYAGRNPAAS